MSRFVKLHLDMFSSFFSRSKDEETTKLETPTESHDNDGAEDWTEKDTSDLMDIMETALTKVKKGLRNKLGKLSSGRKSQSNDTINSLDSLETFVHKAQANTVHVVSEINKGLAKS